MDIKVEWTGKWPCLCYGEWKLIIDGENKSNLIPEDRLRENMDTYGTYRKWRFGNGYEEIWSNYEDGMNCKDWISFNKDWLNNISTDEAIQEQLFYEFQASDWRHGSCGGCI